MNRHELWSAILTTSTALEQLVAAEVGDLPSTGLPTRTAPPQLETAWRSLDPEQRSLRARPSPAQVEPSDRASLIGLRAKFGARLDELWAQLEREPGFERIRKALVIYFDERVMTLLPEYLRLSWPLLQTDITGSKAGGEDFYRFIEVAIDDPKTPSLVFEVHYFCLRHGFRGKHANALATIAEIERRLSTRIELPQPNPASGRARASAAEDGRDEPWPVWTYYALAGLFVVGLCVTLTVLSNRESTANSHVDEGPKGRRSP